MNVKKMFLDIETIPAEESKHEMLREIHAKRMEKFKKTGSVKGEETFEEYLEATGLDGAFGRIACIAYAFDGDPVQTIFGEEKYIINEFWRVARGVDLYVGFNLLDFDLRFIYQRSIILGIKPPFQISFARFRSEPVYDVMWEWSKWGANRISLDTLCKALGIPSPKGGEVEGYGVAKAYAEGKIKQICEYCARDVEATRLIYRKITFS